MELKDKVFRNHGLFTKVMPSRLREWWSLYRMRGYWDRCAKENARQHIAIHDWESEDRFHESGVRDIKKILSSRCIRIERGARILELGCGIGRLLKPLALERSDVELYGVDVSSEMIRQGKERLRDFPNLHLREMNGKDLLLFGNDFFDLVFSYITLQHVPRRYHENLFREVYRVLKQGGVFTFQMQFLANKNKKEPGQNDFRTIRSYSPDELHTMCTQYKFNVLEMNEPHHGDGYLYVTVSK
jgi:ubiquinone/menaquinone biosynthesis C-methylase UbiE